MTFEMEHDGHTLEIDHDRDWGMEILGIKCPHKAELEKIIEVMNRIYWSRRVESPHQEGYLYLTGCWTKPDFTSYDYDDGDAKNAINEIVKIIRSSKESANK